MSFSKRIGLCVAAFLLFGLLSFSTGDVLAANDLYVSDSAGSDTVAGLPNNCRMNYLPPTPNLPCLTIGHAIDQASSGDTIYIDGFFIERNEWITKDLTIASNGVTPSHISANNLDRIFRVFNGSTLVLRDVFLVDGFALEGGAILNEGTVQITDGGLNGNRAQLRGGALFNAFGARATITSSEVGQNSTLNYEGGAIYNEGTFTAEQYTYFHDNNAPTLGGTFFNSEDGSLALFNTNVQTSSAENGGAIHNMGGFVNVVDSTIRYATADYYGGAIFNSFGSLTISGSTIEYNSAHDGGAVYNMTVNDNNLVRIKHSTLGNNSAAHNGGALYDLSSGNFWTVETTTFVKNHAENDGGALFLNGSGTITVEGDQDEISRFEDNTAGNNGGAIYNKANLRLHQSSFAQNSGLNGGAIFNTDDGTLQLERTALIENSATEDGGAIYDEAAQTNLIAVNATFSQNSAGIFGGALFADGGNPVQLANVTLYGNSAPFGGSIYTTVNVSLYNSIITATGIGADCMTGGGSFSGKRNLIDSHASGTCSGISAAAVTHIDPAATGSPAVHAINGLSNAYDNGFNNCPDPLNASAPLAVDQQNNNRLGVNVPCDIGAFELH